jgi:membrane protease YdiL (CAAX protease family)
VRPLILFLLVFATALFTGALITYPLHLLVSLFTEHDFVDLAIRATQICGLLFSLLYLRYACNLSLENIGLKIQPGRLLPEFTYSFLAGLMILLLLATGLMLFGVYEMDSNRVINLSTLTRLAIGAIVTGLAVAVFEETVFRGALQQGLMKKSNTATAIITISIIYAAVHFIDYREPASLDWLTAPTQFMSAYSHLINVETLDAFLSLFVLGLLLGLIRLRTRHIIQCIGLHAGIVAGVKAFRFFLEYNPDNGFNFLISSYDNRLGYLALGLLGVTTIAYYIYAFNIGSGSNKLSDSE